MTRSPAHAPGRRGSVIASCCLLGLLGCSSGSPDDGWEVSSPAAEGMDAALLDGARAYAFQDGKNTQGVVVVRHGRIVAEWYADGADASSYAASWSMAKSFTSALVGIALEEGLIPSLDVAIAEYVPSWQGTEKEAITLEHVLTMSSGLDWSEDYDPANLTTSDVIAMVVTGGSHLAVVEDEPVASPPGTTFNYSSGDTMLLSTVLAQATGMPAHEFAEERLFAPLGLRGVDWWRDTAGDTLTYCCVDMRTRDFARFGQLYLQGGTWEGESVVPAAWVTSTLTSSSTNPEYGYQWWLIGVTEPLLPPDTYSAIGHDGQYVYVLPSLDLVVVRNGIYRKADVEPIASPSLFAHYPSDGLIPSSGTVPPDSWSDVAFLTPIIDSITVP